MTNQTLKGVIRGLPCIVLSYRGPSPRSLCRRSRPRPRAGGAASLSAPPYERDGIAITEWLQLATTFVHKTSSEKAFLKMGKAEICITSHSQEEIEAMVSEFAFGPPPADGESCVVSFSRLFGGYSASNYKVCAKDGAVAVLKIMNGYDKAWVEGQTQLQDRLRAAGYGGVCHCYPLRSASPGKREFVTMTGGTPACLLTFCDGFNAATLLEEGKVEAGTVLATVGRGKEKSELESEAMPVKGRFKTCAECRSRRIALSELGLRQRMRATSVTSHVASGIE